MRGTSSSREESRKNVGAKYVNGRKWNKTAARSFERQSSKSKVRSSPLNYPSGPPFLRRRNESFHENGRTEYAAYSFGVKEIINNKVLPALFSQYKWIMKCICINSSLLTSTVIANRVRVHQQLYHLLMVIYNIYTTINLPGICMFNYYPPDHNY